ncbi:MAG: hypothetical protein NTW05_06600 [Pseudonocardiales bacterium]|jgi:glycosyltransferase involved in cell wall biosynthesis|nr:hypothetical protein [Pseudonocardiales bacterium]
MTVRVVYRSYGGENAKGRPPYYSKALALQATLRAVHEADVEIVFINNGPIPDHLVSVMRRHGEIVTLPDVGMRRSFLTGLRLPHKLGWDPDDIAYFCEDDYLHVPEAFVHLKAAAAELDASYFALYGPLLDDEEPGTPVWDLQKIDSEVVYPRGFTPAPPVEAGGWRWKRILSTTSTFGARVGALRADVPIFWQSGLPHRKMYRDYDMCVTYQGYEAYRWGELGRDLVLRGDGALGERARRAALVPFKAAMNVRSHRRPGNRHALVCAAPNLATHLESAFIAPGRDWAEVAAETADWAATA